MPCEMPETPPMEEAPPVESAPMLTRDEILAAEDLPVEIVYVPEWGGSVFVRTLTGSERDKFEEDTIQGKGKNRRVTLQNIRARLVALTVCDESGTRLFQPADVARLGLKSAAALDRVFSVAQRLSGLTDDDVEELVKNSEAAPGDCSPTG